MTNQGASGDEGATENNEEAINENPDQCKQKDLSLPSSTFPASPTGALRLLRRPRPTRRLEDLFAPEIKTEAAKAEEEKKTEGKRTKEEEAEEKNKEAAEETGEETAERERPSLHGRFAGLPLNFDPWPRQAEQ